ncbi:hypothetical protein DL93DRAFT_1155389 [Clavulina sp. PMI_390]|nr:hypothetical protein DL93DRAFT_1155389 [Clavulina sp. PMI_390]
MPQFQMYGIRVGIEVSSAQLPSAASTTLHRKAPSGQDSESDDEQEPSWARSESPQEHAEPSSSGGPQGARLDGAASESDSESQSDASSRGSQANVVLEASRKQAHTPGPQISLDDLSLASRSRPHTPNRTPSAATTPHAPSTPPTQHKVSRNLAARGTFSVPSHSNTSHPNVPGPSSRRIHSRKSFAELHEQGSPEKVDHTVYVEDNALYFDSSPIRGRAGVGLSSYGGGEDDSDGRANAANDEEDEMDLDDEDVPAWAR